MRFFLVIALAMGLSGCATAQRLDAAGDVHALLVSIRDEDQAAFEAHVDRDALKQEIAARLTAEARKPQVEKGWGALGAILAPALADIAGDALVQPKVFHKVAESYGYKPGQPIPNRVAIAGSLKAMDDGRVCATKSKDGPCVLVFSQENGVWKLSGFEGDISTLRIKL
ncbi:MAG: DUF2939 domain-containing protein [Phenylobacterium sp.]|uniref:DUF2939 domain-containing protein n=1 Tax=Phenylobacterium sp. TaxID=1871053 RepID=UPI001B734A73|nr:DUF2939 domain-containing protein [Phenylobacterium sp.]MBP7650952.1 DUF2939 domain-containing protein [Phenylobacterium sp.]MBP7817302.1 DUF2939 domain-containing protein [Phenylobacterium sp.]MBP9232374.1 DUF2939 domain-containing protein [Phenylobacterium sp.]MBP9756012.1 DUF2939 domain-containing protein [Phenylobacterium sp.]